MMTKDFSMVIAMDEESLKQHLDALSMDGTVANHFKTKLGLQLSLAHSNSMLARDKEGGVPLFFIDDESDDSEDNIDDLLKIKKNSL